METQLRISGMTCSHCVRRVTRLLQSVPGVRLAAVDLTSGHAIVRHNTDADPQEMLAALERESYSAIVKFSRKSIDEV